MSISNESCSEDIIVLYEALRSTSQSNSSCVNGAKCLSAACRNSSNVKDIVCQKIRVDKCSEEWMMLDHNVTEAFDCDTQRETAPLNCSDQFAYSGSICLPLCEKFSYFDETFTTFYIALHGISNGINFIGGIVVVMVSLRKRKKM